jgi:hypothetical protein
VRVRKTTATVTTMTTATSTTTARLADARACLVGTPGRPTPFAGEQVTGHVLDAVPGWMAAPTQYPDLATGVPQVRHDLPPERAGAAGDQD